MLVWRTGISTASSLLTAAFALSAALVTLVPTWEDDKFVGIASLENLFREIKPTNA